MRGPLAAFLLVLATTGAAVPLAAAPGSLPVGAAVERFQPHRASYRLTLERARSGDVASAGGRLSFEWRDVCDGWSVRQLTRVDVSRGEGPSLDFGWSFDSWESKDGTRYRFFIDRFDHGRKTEAISGRARLEAPGEPGQASFKQPVEREVALPAGTVFPTWHSFEMIAMAEAGRQHLWRTVFDGSAEADGLAGVSAVLTGGPAEPTLPKAAEELLAGLPAHRLYLAYYGMNQSAAEPVHEQEVMIYANGIADDFIFDYGDFALRASLVELETLPKPEC